MTHNADNQHFVRVGEMCFSVLILFHKNAHLVMMHTQIKIDIHNRFKVNIGSFMVRQPIVRFANVKGFYGICL